MSDAAPSAWVVRFAPMIRPGGRVLDLACGEGRHSFFLGQQGCRVTAIDRACDSIARHPAKGEIEIIAADLESSDPFAAGGVLAGRDFDGIIVTNYLHRPLLPGLVGALAEEGVLIYETFALGNEAYGSPRNPDFLLQPGELLEAARGKLVVLAYEHGRIEKPKMAVIQRLCARRPGRGDVLPLLTGCG